MAKQKTFNISQYMEEAAKSVEVAEVQRKKEQEAKTQETYAPQTPIQETPQPIAPVAEAPKPYPTPTDNTPTPQPVAPATPDNAQAEVDTKGKTNPSARRGRPKSVRTIERVNGKIVYLEKETDGELARISILERFDKQDIIRTALYHWLKQHYDGRMLDAEGRAEIIDYIQRTSTFEGFE